MNIIKSLQALSGYPVPATTLEYYAEKYGFAPEDDIDLAAEPTANYKRAEAGVYLWLADAPAVSQQGISYSFSDTERKHFRTLANELLNGIGENSAGEYGYKGDRL